LELDESDIMSGYFLIRGSDPAGSERIEVSDEMIVGRSDTCQIIVQDGHPSRRHARLSVVGGALWVEDLQSANGTFVNDQPIKTRTQLHNRDKIAFDLSVFVVAAPGAAMADEATVLRAPAADPEATVLRPHVVEPVAPTPAAAAPPPPDPVPAAAAAPVTPPAPPPAETPLAATPVAAKPAAAAEQPAPPPDAAPAKPANVPRSWADPEFQPEGATRMLTAAELKALAAGVAPGGATPSVDIDEPHLVVVAGQTPGAVLTFSTESGEWSVGTDTARNFKLDDPGISAFHAKISHDNGRWRLIDQMSANGTFVNDEKITVSYLKDGDRVRFAQVECVFHLPTGKGKRGKAKAKAKSKPAGAGGSSSRMWLIAAAAALVTLGALAAASFLL
jgi:pSer/pThr/pTyr-binding forkhead associated (FHA) protein